MKADVFQRSLHFNGVFRAATTVSTQIGILVILMTGCGLGRVNIRKAIEKLTEVKGSSCNFKIILDLLKNGLCLGSAEADTVLYKKQLTYTKNPYVEAEPMPDVVKSDTQKIYEKGQHLGKQAFSLWPLNGHS